MGAVKVIVFVVLFIGASFSVSFAQEATDQQQKALDDQAEGKDTPALDEAKNIDRENASDDHMGKGEKASLEDEADAARDEDGDNQEDAKEKPEVE